MDSSILEKVWSGSFVEDESHLEQVRNLFLNGIVERDGNVELEKSMSASDFERINTLKKYFHWISPCDYYKKFQKSAELSAQLRERANELYKKGDLEQAMRGYNLAIAFGRSYESELGLAYGNRAAVFVSLKKPSFAIRDISLALENKYPLELHEKLIQRRTKCESMKMNNSHKTDGSGNSANSTRDENITLFQKQIFSLTSPSTSLTHAEDFLKVDYEPKCGRRLVVTKEVPTGTVLLVEYPYALTLNEELVWDMKHCNHCLVQIIGGIPCELCTFAMYCSLECKTNGTSSHHKYEPGPLLSYLHCHKMQGREMLALRIITTTGPAKLYELFKSRLHEQENPILSPLRGVDGNTVYESSYAEIYSLITHPESLDLLEKVSNSFKALILTNLLNEASDFFKILPEFQEPDFLDFVASLFLRHLENIPYNSFSFSEFRKNLLNSTQLPNSFPYATGLLPTVSLVNHSCCPNAVHVKNPKFCKATFVTIQKLFPGDEVHISYGPHFVLNNRLERRAKMEDKYKFMCQCQACVENWPMATLNLEGLMASVKCPASICTSTSKSLCPCCLQSLTDLNKRYEDYESSLHEAHEYVKLQNPLDSLKALKILKRCLDTFNEFPASSNLTQVAQDLFKRSLLSCAQAEDVQ